MHRDEDTGLYTDIAVDDVIARPRSPAMELRQSTASGWTFRCTIAHVPASSLGSYWMCAWYLWYETLCQQERVGARAQSQTNTRSAIDPKTTKACYSGRASSALQAGKRGGVGGTFLSSRVCPPPAAGDPWCEACRMRLRTGVSRRPELGWLAACSVMRSSKPSARRRADRPYLEQGWLASARALRSTHGRRVHVQGCPSARALLFRLLRQ